MGVFDFSILMKQSKVFKIWFDGHSSFNLNLSKDL